MTLRSGKHSSPVLLQGGAATASKLDSSFSSSGMDEINGISAYEKKKHEVTQAGKKEEQKDDKMTPRTKKKKFRLFGNRKSKDDHDVKEVPDSPSLQSSRLVSSQPNLSKSLPSSLSLNGKKKRRFFNKKSQHEDAKLNEVLILENKKTRDDDIPVEGTPSSNLAGNRLASSKSDLLDGGKSQTMKLLNKAPATGFHEFFPGQDPGAWGISNHGNTCFISSIVQCLSQVNQFSQYFVRNEHMKDLGLNAIRTHMQCKVTYGLTNLLKALWTCCYAQSHSLDFRNVIRAEAAQYKGYGQHDAQEFFMWILNKVHDELIAVFTKDVKDKKKAAAQTSVVTSVFQGRTVTTTGCSSCRYVSQSSETFLNLSLPVVQPEARGLVVTTVYPAGGLPRATKLGVTVPAQARMADVRLQVAQMLDLPMDRLVLCEIYQDGFHRTFGDEFPVSEIKEEDSVYAALLSPSSDEQSTVSVLALNAKAQTGGFKSFGRPVLVTCRRDVSYLELQSILLRRMAHLMEDYTADKIARVDRALFELLVPEDRGTIQTLATSLEYPLLSDAVDNALRYVGMDGGPKHLKLVVLWSAELKHRLIRHPEPKMQEDLSVPRVRRVGPQSGAVSITDCLSAYTRQETLDDEEWWCPKCRKQVLGARRESKVEALPQVLALHLKRFKQVGSERQKLTTPVDYPVTSLDLRKHLTSSGKAPPADQSMYDLFGVCVHEGTLTEGHYIAYVRNAVSGQWYCCNDSQVYPVKQETVVSRDAYVVFYTQRAHATLPSPRTEHWAYKIPNAAVQDVKMTGRSSGARPPRSHSTEGTRRRERFSSLPRPAVRHEIPSTSSSQGPPPAPLDTNKPVESSSSPMGVSMSKSIPNLSAHQSTAPVSPSEKRRIGSDSVDSMRKLEAKPVPVPKPVPKPRPGVQTRKPPPSPLSLKPGTPSASDRRKEWTKRVVDPANVGPHSPSGSSGLSSAEGPTLAAHLAAELQNSPTGSATSTLSSSGINSILKSPTEKSHSSMERKHSQVRFKPRVDVLTGVGEQRTDNLTDNSDTEGPKPHRDPPPPPREDEVKIKMLPLDKALVMNGNKGGSSPNVEIIELKPKAKTPPATPVTSPTTDGVPMKPRPKPVPRILGIAQPKLLPPPRENTPPPPLPQKKQDASPAKAERSASPRPSRASRPLSPGGRNRDENSVPDYLKLSDTTSPVPRSRKAITPEVSRKPGPLFPEANLKPRQLSPEPNHRPRPVSPVGRPVSPVPQQTARAVSPSPVPSRDMTDSPVPPSKASTSSSSRVSQGLDDDDVETVYPSSVGGRKVQRENRSRSLPPKHRQAHLQVVRPASPEVSLRHNGAQPAKPQKQPAKGGGGGIKDFFRRSPNPKRKEARKASARDSGDVGDLVDSKIGANGVVKMRVKDPSSSSSSVSSTPLAGRKQLSREDRKRLSMMSQVSAGSSSASRAGTLPPEDRGRSRSKRGPPEARKASDAGARGRPQQPFSRDNRSYQSERVAGLGKARNFSAAALGAARKNSAASGLRQEMSLPVVKSIAESTV